MELDINKSLELKLPISYWSGPIFSQIDVGYPLRLSNSTGFKFGIGKKDTLVESVFLWPSGSVHIKATKELSIFLLKLIMSATSFCLHILSAWFQILSFPGASRERDTGGGKDDHWELNLENVFPIILKVLFLADCSGWMWDRTWDQDILTIYMTGDKLL